MFIRYDNYSAYINVHYFMIAGRLLKSPETVNWSMKSRSWINNLCLLAGPITA